MAQNHFQVVLYKKTKGHTDVTIKKFIDDIKNIYGLMYTYEVNQRTKRYVEAFTCYLYKKEKIGQDKVVCMTCLVRAWHEGARMKIKNLRWL